MTSVIQNDPSAGTSASPDALVGQSARNLAVAGSLPDEGHMLYWALVFFIIAVVAGVLGFGGVASAAAGIAQILFFLFLVIFVIALIAGLMGRRSAPPL
jgi:uncharacterized membrane protein YtjA (UPF0391 family)